MNTVDKICAAGNKALNRVIRYEIELLQRTHARAIPIVIRTKKMLSSERGDVPGWVLVVLMTTGLVTAIWTIAAPRLTAILRNSLDAMNGIR